VDQESLDRRSYERSIQQELERMNSRPIESSAIQNAKSILEGNLKELTRFREVATPEEARELDVELEQLRSRLTEIDAELAARPDEEIVEPGPDSRHEARVQGPSATTILSEAINYRRLFEQVLEKRKQNGEKKTELLAVWLKEHADLRRTPVTDYLGGRVKGRVSSEKCEAIEAAILESATKLGLTTRTSSD
jgi:hypothetical protein